MAKASKTPRTTASAPKRNANGKAFSSVDARLTSIAEPWRKGVSELRTEILKSNKAITEHVKWNAPSFCHEGEDRATFRFPPKGGVQLILHRGAKNKGTKHFSFDDPTGLVQWAAADRGVVTFADPADLGAKSKAVVKLVNAWMKATAE